jgi:hypothetical protein
MEQKKSEEIPVKTWPMRPGLRHLATLQRILRVVDLGALGSDDPKVILGALDLAKIEEQHGQAIHDLICDGCDLPRDQVEALSLPDAITLLVRIAALNVRPLPGLLSQFKKPKGPSSASPRN